MTLSGRFMATAASGAAGNNSSNLFPPFMPEPNVTQANWMSPPYNRWGFKNTQNFVTARMMSKGDDPSTYVELPVSPIDYGLENFVYEAHIDPQPILHNETGEPIGVTGTPINRTFGDFLNLTYTDAIVVMHKGEIVYENYFDEQTASTRHINFSVTKSFCGLMASMLANEGLLNPDAMVTDYLPAMADSAFADATVRQVMDMSTDYKYSEDYDDPDSEVVAQMVSAGFRLPPPGYSGPTDLRDFLTQLQKVSNETHGVKFTYRSGNTDLLGWLIDAALSDDPENNTQNSASTKYFEEKIWSKLGQGYDAAIIVDPTHFPGWFGCLMSTARDSARYGLMMLNGGLNAYGERVVPQEVIDDILKGGSELNVEQFAGSAEGAPGMAMDGWAYRNQFWVKPNRIFAHVSIHGQWIWMDALADVVIVKQSSFPTATDWIIDDDTVLAFEALGDYFMSLPEDPNADGEELESTPKQVEQRSSKTLNDETNNDNNAAMSYSFIFSSSIFMTVVFFGSSVFMID